MENLQDQENLQNMSEFQAWKGLLERWNARINLVSRSAMEDFWGRHAHDSWQLWPHVPENTRTILDLGSGAGFPGIAMAIGAKYHNAQTPTEQAGQGANPQQMHVTLVESAGKKANFLKTVIRELSLPATVWADRAENLPVKPYDLITARAFAPLPRLLAYAHPFWGQGTSALLLKGQSAKEELTQAQKSWKYHVREWPSQTDPDACILHVTDLSPRT